MSGMSPASPSRGDDRRGGGGGRGSMYRFLECTAGQYMTRAVTTVTREVDMRELKTFFSVVLDCTEAPADAPAQYSVYLSTDGKYDKPAVTGLYGGAISTAKFDTAQLARYVKIELTQAKTKWWSINELNVVQ